MLTIEEIRNNFFFIFQIKACFYSNFVKSEQVSHRQKKKKRPVKINPLIAVLKGKWE